ncbi:MAG: aminoacyl-tRNA hydrolase [Candidatus Amoebophilus sp. 36-38]|nr:MAG: aminoacyl-tRNA hydrolase [Candidatus Amoebophilus sp. 36-38]
MKYLIIGLGNMGPEYDLTRHNIGFQVVDQLAVDHQAKFEVDRLALLASFKYKGRSLYLIKPTTYMNQSGKAAQYWLTKLKIPIENSLTIVDDLALPFGKLRLRAQGSSAGHNGLKSMEMHVATQDYPRLRFGIGNDFSKGQQANYVLAPFSSQEQELLASPINQACEIILSFCTIGINRTMEKYNSD